MFWFFFYPEAAVLLVNSQFQVTVPKTETGDSPLLIYLLFDTPIQYNLDNPN